MKYFELIILLIILSKSTAVLNRKTQGFSICSKKVSYTASRYVSYPETYQVVKWGIFYETKVRWNYKKEYYTAYRTEDVCCEGYKDVGSLLCDPICEPPCKNSKCIAPNVCKCYPGYLLSFDNLNTCEPACSEPCINGKCTKPDFCTCDRGYKMTEDGFTCKPICSVDCEKGHATCSKPNLCTCHQGYWPISTVVLKENEICEPHCMLPCLNGECTEPDVCTCHDGYELHPQDPFTCRPVCDGCLYGTCTAPNTCTCNKGYKPKNKNVCEPICSKECVMGKCILPETCSCNEGYGILNSRYICEPICEKACINGTCTAPGFCACNDGYRVSGDEMSKHICEPYCKISCSPYGKCTAPDTCTCLEGYRLIDQNEGGEKKKSIFFAENSICAPVCQQTCVNGYCSAPGVCTCEPGYKPSANDPNTCQPICSEICVNGYCAGPNNCKCDPGYHAKENSTDYCLPYCQEDCVNALCTKPDVCTCNDGYEPSKYWPNICNPICEKPCVNGYCANPDVCACWTGYVPLKNDSTICEPFCQQTCVNGFCSNPNSCSCKDGYVPTTNESNICEPYCENPCRFNEICTAPNTCECKSEYQSITSSDNTISCVPICDIDCENGNCVSPNVCTCHAGFAKNEIGKCSPVCTSCDNGNCVEPEICECNEGFISTQQFQNKTVCIPYCENCANGNCITPGECQCLDGYTKSWNIDNSSDIGCVWACENNCSDHGVCSAESRNCKCDFGWQGSNCDQPSFCIVIMDTVNNTDLTTESVNETIGEIVANNPLCRYECMDEVNNETLCISNHNRSTTGNYSFACLIATDSTCYTVAADQYRKIANIPRMIGIVAGIVAITTGVVVASYLILRKHRKRRMSLGNMPSVSMQGRASLLPEETDNL